MEFVASSRKYCALIEQTGMYTLKEFINQIHILLPELYLKVAHLPVFESPIESQNQRYVTEEAYDYIYNKLLVKLGEYDAYEEVFDPNRIESENAIGASISEDLADIYQDIKDFILLYEMGPGEIIDEAFWEVRQSFELYWGQKLVNTLRAIHNLRFSEEEIEESEFKPQENANFKRVGNVNWIISKRQEESRDDK